MKRTASEVELLGEINKMKQDGKTLDEIIKIMEREGLHRENTTELFSMLK